LKNPDLYGIRWEREAALEDQFAASSTPQAQQGQLQKYP